MDVKPGADGGILLPQGADFFFHGLSGALQFRQPVGDGVLRLGGQRGDSGGKIRFAPGGVCLFFLQGRAGFLHPVGVPVQGQDPLFQLFCRGVRYSCLQGTHLFFCPCQGGFQCCSGRFPFLIPGSFLGVQILSPLHPVGQISIPGCRLPQGFQLSGKGGLLFRQGGDGFPDALVDVCGAVRGVPVLSGGNTVSQCLCPSGKFRHGPFAVASVDPRFVGGFGSGGIGGFSGGSGMLQDSFGGDFLRGGNGRGRMMGGAAHRAGFPLRQRPGQYPSLTVQIGLFQPAVCFSRCVRLCAFFSVYLCGILPETGGFLPGGVCGGGIPVPGQSGFSLFPEGFRFSQLYPCFPGMGGFFPVFRQPSADLFQPEPEMFLFCRPGVQCRFHLVCPFHSPRQLPAQGQQGFQTGGFFPVLQDKGQLFLRLHPGTPGKIPFFRRFLPGRFRFFLLPQQLPVFFPPGDGGGQFVFLRFRLLHVSVQCGQGFFIGGGQLLQGSVQRISVQNRIGQCFCQCPVSGGGKDPSRQMQQFCPGFFIPYPGGGGFFGQTGGEPVVQVGAEQFPQQHQPVFRSGKQDVPEFSLGDHGASPELIPVQPQQLFHCPGDLFPFGNHRYGRIVQTHQIRILHPEKGTLPVTGDFVPSQRPAHTPPLSPAEKFHLHPGNLPRFRLPAPEHHCIPSAAAGFSVQGKGDGVKEHGFPGARFPGDQVQSVVPQPGKIHGTFFGIGPEGVQDQFQRPHKASPSSVSRVRM